MFAWIQSLASRTRLWLSRNQVEDDFEQELESHLNMLTDENVRRGMSPEEARRAATSIGRPHPAQRYQPRTPGPAHDRDVLAGHALRFPHAAEESRLHGRRGTHACSRYRRQHGNFQRRLCRAPEAAALYESRSVVHRLSGEHAARDSGDGLFVSEFRRVAGAESCFQRTGGGRSAPAHVDGARGAFRCEHVRRDSGALCTSGCEATGGTHLFLPRRQTGCRPVALVSETERPVVKIPRSSEPRLT